MSDVQSINPVDGTATYEFGLQLFERAGKVHAAWEIKAPPSIQSQFQPHYFHVELHQPNGPHIPHLISVAKGTHDFNVDHGAGYYLRLVAEDYNNNQTEIVRTAVTSHGSRQPIGSAKYTYTLTLSNFNNKARIAWETGAKFRGRDLGHGLMPAVVLYVAGKEKGQRFHVDRSSDHVDTGIHWGVTLSAAWIAQNFEAQEVAIVRTSTTRDVG